MIYVFKYEDTFGDMYKELLNSMKDGDVEVIDIEIWVVITCDTSDTYDDGPHFGGTVGNAYGVYSEKIDKFVNIVANTEITQKLYKDRIWKQSKEWLIVKK